MFKLIV